MSGTLAKENFDRIWLEPREGADPYIGRQWCQDNLWGEDGIEYVRADLVSAPAMPPGSFGIEDSRLAYQCDHASPDAKPQDIAALQARIVELEAERNMWIEQCADAVDEADQLRKVLPEDGLTAPNTQMRG